MKIHFIQDIATAHNNVLLKAINKNRNLSLKLWYCKEKSESYSGNSDLLYEVTEPFYYSSEKLDWAFIREILFDKTASVMLVGWMNFNTRLLLLLFFIFRRPFNMWFDFPQDNKNRSVIKRFLRETMFFLAKYSVCKIFCVGQITIDYFQKRGFALDRLINLPIIIDLEQKKNSLLRKDFCKKYNIPDDGILLSAGSRLIYEKGFDILVESIAYLPIEIQKKTFCVIVGKGEEKENLEKLIKKYGLETNIFLENWMKFEDFQSLISASNAFIHPARFDAFGASIFALALSVPVIGSYNAGAVVDRVQDGYNGFVYYDNDKVQLSELIHKLARIDGHIYDNLRENARKSSLKWEPKIAVKIMKRNMLCP